MYKIEDHEFTTLDLAMQYAKSLNRFVTITGNNFEICGKFGVDSVVDGKTPDGHVYDWNKKSRIGRVKKDIEYDDEDE